MRVSFSSLWRKGKPKPELAKPAPPPAPNGPTPPRSALDPVWPAAGTAAVAWMSEPGVFGWATADLLERTPASLKLRLEQPAETGRPAWLILDDGADCTGKTLSCENDGRGFAVEIELARKSQPQEDTTLTQLRWLDAQGNLAHATASLRNATEGRIEVRSGDEVPSPAIALLAGKGFQCLGAVRGCQSLDGRWAVEIEVLGEAYSRPQSAS